MLRSGLRKQKRGVGGGGRTVKGTQGGAWGKQKEGKQTYRAKAARGLTAEEREGVRRGRTRRGLNEIEDPTPEEPRSAKGGQTLGSRLPWGRSEEKFLDASRSLVNSCGGQKRSRTLRLFQVLQF